MKTLFVVVSALLLTGCGARKNTAKSPADPIVKDCPVEGTCKMEVLPNKSLEVRSDESGGLYYQLTDAENTTVVLYQYDKNVPANLADAGYRETIVFEVNNTDQLLDLSGKALQQTKMLFGRMCFCARGQTGNFRVEQGSLKLSNGKDGLRFRLDFKVPQLPQVIHTIELP